MAIMNAFMTQPPPQTKANIIEKLREKQETTPAKSSTQPNSMGSSPMDDMKQEGNSILQSLYKGVAPKDNGMNIEDHRLELSEVSLVLNQDSVYTR